MNEQATLTNTSRHAYRFKSCSLRKIILSYLSLFYQRSRTRRQLRQLPDCQLADIGLTRDQALREARKPFWQ